MADQPIENAKLFRLIGRVNGLYFWMQVGAEKSVKYVLLTSLALSQPERPGTLQNISH